MQVEFTQITINRSFKVFLIVFVVVLILSFVSGFHFYLWWRKVSGRHTSCVPRLESRTFRRELLSCTQTTFTFSQIFQNSSFQQTWSTSTLLFLQVIWFHCDYQNPNKAFIEISTRLCITCLVHNCKCFAASKLIQHQWSGAAPLLAFIEMSFAHSVFCNCWTANGILCIVHTMYIQIATVLSHLVKMAFLKV